jgi:hypothetical protein
MHLGGRHPDVRQPGGQSRRHPEKAHQGLHLPAAALPSPSVRCSAESRTPPSPKPGSERLRTVCQNQATDASVVHRRRKRKRRRTRCPGEADRGSGRRRVWRGAGAGCERIFVDTRWAIRFPRPNTAMGRRHRIEVKLGCPVRERTKRFCRVGASRVAAEAFCNATGWGVRFPLLRRCSYSVTYPRVGRFVAQCCLLTDCPWSLPSCGPQEPCSDI